MPRPARTGGGSQPPSVDVALGALPERTSGAPPAGLIGVIAAMVREALEYERGQRLEDRYEKAEEQAAEGH